MTRYGRLRENEKALRVITLEEERQLVQKVTDESLIIGCYIGLLGETGLRKSEGLKLKWDYVDILIGDTNGSKSDVLVNC